MSDPRDESPLRLDGLVVEYGKRRLLDEVSLAVPRGAVYVLLGSNGEGKTSAVRCMLGLQRPRAGRVLLFGRDVWRERVALLARVGSVPETPDAPPQMTVPRLTALCAPLYPSWDQPALEERLARHRIARDVPFASLSRGQQALVQLALALAPRPELLVLDDPTLGLDAVARKTVLRELIAELADRGTTVLLTTHDLHEVEPIATHVGILRDGKLAIDAELEQLKLQMRSFGYRENAVPSLEEIFTAAVEDRCARP